MNKLVKFMQYKNGSEDKRARLLDATDDPNVKKLLLSEEMDKGILIKKEVQKTIIDAMKPHLVMRSALPTAKVSKPWIRIPYVRDAGKMFAPVVKEGQEIPTIDPEKLDYKDFTVEKHGFRPLITREMVEDSEYDVVARELRRVGEMLENTVNKEALEVLMKDADHLNDCVTRTDIVTVRDIADCVFKVRNKGYVPDTMVLSPRAESDLLTDVHFLSAPYRDETALREGKFGTRLLGLRIYTTNVPASFGANDFGGNKSMDPVALIYDKDQAASIMMREELRVTRYDDPIRDIVGMTCENRFGVRVIQAESISMLKLGGTETKTQAKAK